MIDKLVLGSANFGLKYGLSKKGFTQNQVIDILSFSKLNNIKFIDTAQSYGDAEIKIGNYIKSSKTNFNIISKFRINKKFVHENLFETSLNNLNVSKLYGFLYHDFSEYLKHPSIYNLLLQKKKLGLIKKIGFSLYYPNELEYLLNKNITFDIVQIPYNIFDRRFEYLFSRLKKRNIEINVRSIFLQGLLFMNKKSLPKSLSSALPYLKKLNKKCKSLELSILESSLYFVIYNNLIDKVTLGIDSKVHLKDILFNLKKKVDYVFSEEFKNLEVNDENIILPINWK